LASAVVYFAENMSHEDPSSRQLWFWFQYVMLVKN